MPRGKVRCGSLTSSAEVATTSKPRKAKNTSAAPDTTPSQPYWLGAAPNSQASMGWPQASPVTPCATTGGWAGGTKGVKWSGFM